MAIALLKSGSSCAVKSPRALDLLRSLSTKLESQFEKTLVAFFSKNFSQSSTI